MSRNWVSGKIILYFAFLSFLSGCGGSAVVEDAIPPQSRYPISISTTETSLEIFLDEQGESDLSDNDRRKIEAFIHEYQNIGRGSLDLSVPIGIAVEEEEKGRNLAFQISQIIDKTGVGESLDIFGYTPEQGQENAVILSYSHYRATATPCVGRWMKNVSDNPRNNPVGGFGCSFQHNLAIMIADPGDLNTPRPVTNADGVQRNTIIESFRTRVPSAESSAVDEGFTVSN